MKFGRQISQEALPFKANLSTGLIFLLQFGELCFRNCMKIERIVNLKMGLVIVDASRFGVL